MQDQLRQHRRRRQSAQLSSRASMPLTAPLLAAPVKGGSNLNAESDFDNSIVGYFEVIRRAACNLAEERKDRKGNAAHRGPLLAPNNGFVRDVIVLLVRIAIKAEHAEVLQCTGNVGRLHESKPHPTTVEAMSDILDFVAFGKRNARPA